MILLRHTLFPRLAVLSAAAALVAVASVRADLAASSPFLPAGAAAGPGAGAGPADPVELRGIMALPDGFAYCIYDTAKKSSSWVGLNETGNDFVVKSADAATDSVMVSLGGRDIRLALKVSKVVSTGSGSAGATVAPGSVLGAPTPGEEQKRLDAVANEVRRRRQEREKAAQNGGPGTPGSPAPRPAFPNH
ncbi:MAG TPA: hypothetical protein VII43_08465 [Opitutaceae bacterium]